MSGYDEGKIEGARQPNLKVIAGMGLAQILAWGSSYYLLAVLAQPIARDTGWPDTWIVGALSLGLLVAGLASPHVGNLIARFGGRPILASSALCLFAGLLLQAVAANLAVFMLAWLLIGFGMGAGLYDPAFSTLGRLYQERARSAITNLTLIAGFASTVCWPLSAYLVAQFGWRGASAVYALLDIAVVLPLYLLCVPRESAAPIRTPAHGRTPVKRTEPIDRYAFVLVAAGLTVASMIMTIISVSVLILLQARGLTLAAAVALGALIGPSQVGARVLEAAFGRRFHPIYSFLASSALVGIGLAMLAGPSVAAAVGFVLYGAGSGIRSIVRGTLPLALFGVEGYAVLMGWLAMPSLVAQAASPTVGTLLLNRFGADATILILVGIAAFNLMLAVPLLSHIRRRSLA